MKLLYLLIILLSVSQSKNISAQDNAEQQLDGFRNIKWNSSIKDVKSQETETYLQTFSGFGKYTISYISEIIDLKTRIDYSFEENKLIEGSYVIESDLSEFLEKYINLREFLIKEYGLPDYYSGTKINSDSNWVKETEYGKYKGPELYWAFSKGFICLHGSRFEEDVTITILYAHDKSIFEYSEGRRIDVKTFQ
ncbi:hypothetical protein ACFLS9_10270 [Bacteroidota bacterium]